jgi:SAM-dependent methyltransferase
METIELRDGSSGSTAMAGEDLYAVRARIAQQYIKGAGIEFGALHAPLSVAADVAVKYADREPVDQLNKSYADVDGIMPPDIITDIESMRGIPDQSQDFVIANHVLEHVEDPIRALASIGRVLRAGGVAFIALPDKRFTFDRDREITPLSHLVRDNEKGPEWSLAAHYDEWCRCVDGLQGQAHSERVALMLEDRTNIHFHVWDYAAMTELFSFVASRAEPGFDVEVSLFNQIEVIWILRKRGGTGAIGGGFNFKRVGPDVNAGLPACPICDELVRKEVWMVVDCHRQVLECAECGFTFVWPRIEQDFSNIPEDAYYLNWELLDLSGSRFLYADVVAGLGRGVALGERGRNHLRAVLDVGCGAGHVLLDFRAHGWSVRGVDPWSAVAAAGRKYYRLPIETARMETAQVPPESQDVVLALDVLQYIAQPKMFLRACLVALKRGGLLYLTLPNFESTESRREGWTSQYFQPMSYLNYFTRDTVQRLVEAAGLHCVQIDFFGGDGDDLFLRVRARRPVRSGLTWTDLSEEVDDFDLPPLDRRSIDLARLSPEQRAWRENGYLIVPELIPEHLIDGYCAVRRHVSLAEGWTSPSPYLDIPEIRDLCLHQPLMDLLEQLIGEPLGLHLNLTGWVSTERDWHQDDYLNPAGINGHYAAVWTALDRIRLDAGPFEFVPGSHRWPIIRQAKVLRLLGYTNVDDPTWPYDSELLLTPFFEEEIKHRGATIERFLGNKGDVLIWHARLLHRGSRPAYPGSERRSMIAHYSAVSRRTDFPNVRRHPGGGLYFLR